MSISIRFVRSRFFSPYGHAETLRAGGAKERATVFPYCGSERYLPSRFAAHLLDEPCPHPLTPQLAGDRFRLPSVLRACDRFGDEGGVSIEAPAAPRSCRTYGRVVRQPSPSLPRRSGIPAPEGASKAESSDPITLVQAAQLLDRLAERAA